MRKIVEILSIFGIMLSISIVCNSCKTSNKSDLSAINVNCPCDDVECWRNNSNEASNDAINCASQSFNAAVSLLRDNVSKVMSLFNSVQLIAVAFKNATLNPEIKTIGDLIVTYQQEAFKHIGNQCTPEVGSIMGVIWNLLKDTIDPLYSIAESYNNGEPIEKLIYRALSSITQSKYLSVFYQSLLATSTDAIIDCTIKLSKTEGVLGKISASLKPVVDFFTIFDVVKACGPGLMYSSLVLVYNSGCTTSAWISMMNSSSSVEKLKQNSFDYELDCNRERELNCPQNIASRYGMRLDKMISNQSYPIYWINGSRAYQCYIGCYTTKAEQLCSYVELGKLKNADTCKKICPNLIKGDDCKALCTSYCCNLENSCVEEVKNLHKSYSK